jgi:predicted TPR repeat methyltransferase
MEALSLKGTKVTFTGKTASITREEAYALVREFGGEPTNAVSRHTSFVIVGMEGWPLLPDGKISNKLKRAEELIRQGHSIRIISEETFLEGVGRKTLRDPLTQKTYQVQEVCSRLRLSPEILQRWEQFGLIRSQGGFYDFQDLVSLRTIAELVSRGVRPETIGRSLKALESILPNTDRPLAQLKIVVENPKALLVDLGDHLIAPSGQLLMNFEPRAHTEGKVVHFSDRTTNGKEWFELGQKCEDEENYPGAAEAYRKAASLQRSFPEACFNLGNVLRLMGQPKAAIEAYQQALSQDHQMAVAWYNLADVQEELGQVKNAVHSLQKALEAYPNYADAHFNLALCCEKLEDKKEANRHWAAYLKLDPSSRWARIARRHLEES